MLVKSLECVSNVDYLKAIVENYKRVSSIQQIMTERNATKRFIKIKLKIGKLYNEFTT